MTGPLTGTSVIEFAGLGPAPFAAMVLADLGADVLRIDRAGASLDACTARRDVVSRGRRSIALNLKSERGLGLARTLIGRADVLVEGFRPGVMERLGIGPDDCAEVNARLIYSRMTGWGQTGPLAQKAGHDINYISLSGALAAIGRTGEPPVPPLNLVGDYGGGGMLLVVGVLAALLSRAQTGQGQVVDAAMVDGSALLMAAIYGLRANGEWADRRGANLLDTGTPYYDVYETADGEFMAVGSLEPKFFAELVERLGLGPEWLAAQSDKTRWPGLRAALADRFRSRTRAEWAEHFASSDACVTPILSMAEAPAHPHVAERGTLVEHLGLVQPAPAPRFSGTAGRLSAPPPQPGEHTREVLAELGLAEMLEAWVGEGIVSVA
jgi:alpha-methylacyl-CoA racemase